MSRTHCVILHLAPRQPCNSAGCTQCTIQELAPSRLPNRTQPFESAFTTLELASLSASHITVDNEKSPDESMRFRSVIGSIWSVEDEVARQVVSAFDGSLVDDSGRLHCTRAALWYSPSLRPSISKKSSYSLVLPLIRNDVSKLQCMLQNPVQCVKTAGTAYENMLTLGQALGRRIF